MEVIADSTYFESWEDNFSIEASKKVVVERIENNAPVIQSPKVSVIKEEPIKETINVIESFSKHLLKNGVTIVNIKETKQNLPKLLESYIKQYKPQKEDIKHLIKNIGKCVEYL